MSGMFKGYGPAKITEQGIKCSDGKHVLEIQRNTLSRDGKHGTFAVAEFKVISSDNDNDKPGDERVWTQNMSKTVVAAPKCIAYMQAAMGYHRKNAADTAEWKTKFGPDDIETMLENLFDETDPLGFAGRKVVAVTKLIESNGHPFTTYDFLPGDTTKLEI